MGEDDLPGIEMMHEQAAVRASAPEFHHGLRGTSAQQGHPERIGRFLLGAGLMLVALNLRPLFSSLSAVLPEVMRGTGADPAAITAMTAGPVLCLGVFSPLVGVLVRRIGMERTVHVALSALTVGTALRGAGSVTALLAGGTLAGAGIAFCNVLLPSFVKRDFPDRIASLTGLYSMSLSAGAALAAALTVPLARHFGDWAYGLGAWALPAAVATVAWSTRAGRGPAPSGSTEASAPLWRDWLAWQVTLFMGLQSALAYSVFGWLAPIMRSRGVEASSAGFLLSLSVMGQMVGCIAAPSLATLGKDQRAASVILYGLVLAGLLGCFFAPLGGAWAFAVLLGLGQGGLLAVALTIILLRAPDAATAAALSGMAQGVGYTLAAGGPLLVGAMRQIFGGFGQVPILLVLLCVLGMLAGLGAGRDLKLGRPSLDIP